MLGFLPPARYKRSIHSAIPGAGWPAVLWTNRFERRFQCGPGRKTHDEHNQKHRGPAQGNAGIREHIGDAEPVPQCSNVRARLTMMT